MRTVEEISGAQLEVVSQLRLYGRISPVWGKTVSRCTHQEGLDQRLLNDEIYQSMPCGDSGHSHGKHGFKTEKTRMPTSIAGVKS